MWHIWAMCTIIYTCDTIEECAQLFSHVTHVRNVQNNLYMLGMCTIKYITLSYLWHSQPRKKIWGHCTYYIWIACSEKSALFISKKVYCGQLKDGRKYLNRDTNWQTNYFLLLFLVLHNYVTRQFRISRGSVQFWKLFRWTLNRCKHPLQYDTKISFF